VKKTRIGVIGLGTVAQLVHLPNFSKIKNAEVTAVAEIKSHRLMTVADKFNIPHKYKNYKDLLENSDVDAVIITTPTSQHKEIAIDCLNAKKDVLIEKPIARTYTEAKSIVDAAEKNNCKLMVGMNLRYRPDLMLIRTLINAGEIGQPFYLKCSWVRRQSSSENWFMKREEAGGGVLLDLGIHLLDVALWLLDNPEVNSVSTQNYYQSSKNLEDTSLSFIRCSNSSIINLESSWSLADDKDSFNISVYGSKGSISTTPFKLYKRIGEENVDLKPSMTESPSQLFKKSYLNELKSFIGAISGLNPVFSSGEEGMNLLKISETMYKSAEQDKEIKIS
jgi:predicted dehydrogenase